jgi:hypothetical protein
MVSFPGFEPTKSQHENDPSFNRESCSTGLARSGGDPANTSSGRLGCFARIVITWRAVINFLVPIGYEDETGFHYGESLARNGHSELTTF